MQKQIDYEQLGEQAKQTREELFKLFRMSEGMPNSIRKYIVASIDKLDSFRCKAENRMFVEHPEQSVDVLYGKRKSNSK